MTPLERRRRYGREYAQRKRDRALDERRRRNGDKCPRRFGHYGVCGARLFSETTRKGTVRIRCPACERMARGICMNCPNPVDGYPGKARRCRSCKTKEKIAATRRCEQKDPARRKRMHKEAHDRYFADPKRRQRKLDYKRAWRQAHPDLVAAQKRREALRQSAYSHDYHVAYRAAHQDQRFAWGVGHKCPCGAALTGRAKKCETCKTKQRDRARAFLAKHHGRGRRTDLE